MKIIDKIKTFISSTKGKRREMAKRGAFFGTITLASAALGIAGLAVASGALMLTVSALTLGLSAVWGTLAGRAIKRAYKGEAETVTIADDRKTHKTKLKTALNTRQTQIQQARANYTASTQSARNSRDTARATYKSDPTTEHKTDYVSAAQTFRTIDAAARSTKKTELHAIPKTTKGFKVGRGLAIAGICLAGVLSLLSGATLFDNVNNADTFANESGGTQTEFLNHQGLKNDALGISMAATNAVAAIGGAVVAVRARKKQEEAIIDYAETV